MISREINQLNYSKEAVPETTIQSFFRDNMVMRVIRINKRFCLEYEEVYDGYDFFLPLKGRINLRAGHAKLAIGDSEMACINPWQLRQLLPLGDDLNLAQITYKETYIAHLFSELYGSILKGFFNRPIPVDRDLYAIIDNLISENYLDSPGKRLMLDSFINELSINLLRHAVQAGAINERRRTCCSHMIANLIEFIHKNYAQNITDLELADQAHISRHHLIRQFKKTVGTTPYDYLMDVRISNAKKLLVETELSIQRISAICGFSTSSHFAEIFRKKAGFSPSEFRNQKQALPEYRSDFRRVFSSF